MKIWSEGHRMWTGEHVHWEIKLNKLRLPWLSRLYLGRWNYSYSEGGEEDFKALIVERFRSAIRDTVDNFDYRPLRIWNHTETVEAIVAMVQSNLDLLIASFTWEASIEVSPKTGISRRIFNPYKMWIHANWWMWSDDAPGITKNWLFYLNLRHFLWQCFQNTSLMRIIEDIIMVRRAETDTSCFTSLQQQFQWAIELLVKNEVRTMEPDDLRQEYFIVLWRCVQQYKGQNFGYFRQYFLRSLKNKQNDFLREIITDKRRVRLHSHGCSFSWNSGDCRTEHELNDITAKRWQTVYHQWLSNPDESDLTWELARNDQGLSDTCGKSLSRFQIHEWSHTLYRWSSEHMLARVEHLFDPKRISAFRYWCGAHWIVEKIIEEQFGSLEDRNILKYLRTYWAGRVKFDGDKTVFGEIHPDLKRIFLERLETYLALDPMIQKHVYLQQHSTESLF